ncbi:hypothetical protein Bca4012_085735 [Brassica carinata]
MDFMPSSRPHYLGQHNLRPSQVEPVTIDTTKPVSPILGPYITSSPSPRNVSKLRVKSSWGSRSESDRCCRVSFVLRRFSRFLLLSHLRSFQALEEANESEFLL